MSMPRKLTIRSPMPGVSPRMFWCVTFLVVFAVQIVLRFSVIGTPPYEDQAVGIWAEAEFLADTDFDYYRLRYDEKNFMEGGSARSYMISVLPTLLALLFRSGITPHATLVIAHLFVFACAAGIVVLVILVLTDKLAFPVACLVAAAMWSTPPMLAQMDMVGMDVAMLAMGMVSTVLVLRQRYLLAASASTLAFFIKGSASLFTMATIAFLILLIVAGWREMEASFRRQCFRGLVANVLALVLQRLAAAWADDPVLSLQGLASPDMLAFPRMLLWCWDMSLLWFVAATVTTISIALGISRVGRGLGVGIRRISALYQGAWRGICKYPLGVYSWILVGGLSFSIHLFVFFPRYFAPGIVFLYLIVGEWISTLGRLRRLATWSLIAVIMVNVVNRDGKLYFSSEKLGADEFALWTMWHPRMCVLTERSLEYAQAFDGERRALRLLATEYADHPLFVERLYANYLTRPRLGIVDHPLPRVCSVEDYALAIEQFLRYMPDVISGESTSEPIFLWSGKSRTRIPPPDERYCEVLFRDDHFEPIVVYRLKPEALPKTKEALSEWYLEHTWDTTWIAMRALERSGYLQGHGRQARAIKELRLANDLGPSDHEILTPLVRARLADLESVENSDSKGASKNP